MENTNKTLLRDCDLMVLTAGEVADILSGQELAVLDVVSKAYKAHGKGQTSLPHSTFLRFPDNPANRIIALPAYLGGEVEIAGMKWIASFPANVDAGADRASAILILNSTATGHPRAVLESSMISAWRTAASAAVAAQTLTRHPVTHVGLVGCGVINFEVLRFLQVAFPHLERIVIYDSNRVSQDAFKIRCSEKFSRLNVELALNLNSALRNVDVVSFATTAAQPYVQSLSMCGSNTVVLHISLRDLAPEVILASENVVDDADHVCRAQTSIHLAEQQTGHRSFIRCALGDILNGEAAFHHSPDKITVFSPFGLGILDLTVGNLVLQLASQKGKGTVMRSFLPAAWRRRSVTVTA